MLVRRVYKLRHYGAGILPQTFATAAAAEAARPAVQAAHDPQYAHHQAPAGQELDRWTRVVPALLYFPDELLDVAMRFEQLPAELEAAALAWLEKGLDPQHALTLGQPGAGSLTASPSFAGTAQVGG